MSVLNKITKCSCGLSCYVSNSHLRSVNLQLVRFRKPRWVPKAPSKIYKVREPTPIDPIEYEKMKEWTTIYNTEFKSVRAFITQYHSKLKAKQERDVQSETLSWKSRFSEMTTKNNAWNKSVAEVRLRDEKDQQLVQAVKEQKVQERSIREQEEMREGARQKVLEVARHSSEYIPEDALDSEIEKLLNSRVSYEFAITPEGTIVGTDETESELSSKQTPHDKRPPET